MMAPGGAGLAAGRPDAGGTGEWTESVLGRLT